MLKLIFSPYYDGNCYAGNPEKNGCVLGTKHVGPLGLLNELELRAGLSRGETFPMQRAIAYCNAIHEALNSQAEDPFYKQSFKNDPLGVAQQLLRWRDALCMAGWTKDTKLPNSLSADGKKRLEDLQAVEAHFDRIGIGERWQALLAEATAQNILPNDVTIEVDMKMELLPPVIRKVLETIQAKGGKADVSQAVKDLGDKTLKDFAKKLELYQFPEQNDAYQWAALTTNEADVYINEDNFTFNQVLKSVGKPLVGASVEGATDLSQLLKLGISLFRSPVNYANLISYLSVFRHPIDWETRSSLLYHLKKMAGFGDLVNKDGSITKIADTVKNYSDFWCMWDNCKGDKVPVGKVVEFCKNIKKWAEGALVKAGAEKALSPLVGTQVYAQMSLLQEQTDLMLLFLAGKSGDITNDELDKVVTSICQGSSVSVDFARLGSYDMLKDIKGLAIDGKTVMWMDCVLKPRPKHEYSFLNPADIKILQDSGMLIPDTSLEMQASDFAERLAVGRAEKIIVLMPQRKDGARTAENLLITEMKSLQKAVTVSSPGLPKGITIKTVAANTQKAEHQVAPTLFSNIENPKPLQDEEQTTASTPFKFTPKPVGYQRDYESFSSLNELINQPFDYVLDYIYNMKDEDEGNLSTVEGNVAHAVIEQIVAECKDASGNVDTTKFLNICNKSSNLEARTDKAILEVGAQLLQPENEMECTVFKRIFIKKSVPVLVKIIKDNSLEVVGSEVEYTTMLKDSSGTDAFNFNAKIDFLLKRKIEESKKYEYLIFDFKWTGNPNKRKEELEKCKELQLALYQKIAEDNGLLPVVMRGYYLLKQAQLLTVNNVLKTDDNIVIVEQKSTYNIFEQAVASYRKRIQDLKEGWIEEGEEMKGPEFIGTKFIDSYYPNSDKFYLSNGLTATSKKDGMTANVKKSSYSKNAVLKGKIE